MRPVGNNAENGSIICIGLHAPPEKNKANERVVEILEDYFKANVKIVSGEKSRKKIVEIL